MSGGRDRSLITAWVVGLAVCGIAAGLTLVIDRVGRPTTEIHVGDQGDSAQAVGEPVAVASSAGEAAPPTTNAAETAPTVHAPPAPPVSTMPPTPSVATTGSTVASASVAAAAGAAEPGASAPIGAAAAEQRSGPGAPPRRQSRGVPATPRQLSVAERTAATRAVSERRAARVTTARRAAARSAVATSAPIDSEPAWRVARPSLSPTTIAAVSDSVRAVLDRAASDSAFPGAFAVVGTGDSVLAARGVGRLDWAESVAPDARTIWDLASLTKVIGTTTAMMQLVERGTVDLDAPVQRYLPAWTGPRKDRVTVRHLLTHTSGLPAFRLFYKTAASPQQLLAMVYAEPLDSAPGARFVYSDLGAILLGEIVAKVGGRPLDAYLATNVFRPLRMTSTGFRPDSGLLPRIAPTERDPWRGRLVRGEVHDENAFALGGVAGHAGLFSTAADLSRFAQMMLDGGALNGTRLLQTATLRRFTALQDSARSNRALGWEKPTGANSAGRRLSTAAFGHTGFTGTSLWIDPANDVYILLLSNRVDPTRANNRIRTVRPALADAVMGALGVPAPPATAAR